jgi:hypothetical protein
VVTLVPDAEFAETERKEVYVLMSWDLLIEGSHLGSSICCISRQKRRGYILLRLSRKGSLARHSVMTPVREDILRRTWMFLPKKETLTQQ